MLAGCTELDCIDFHEQPDAQLLAYQRIIKQSGVVLAVYAPDLADGSAEDKAVSYALALGRPILKGSTDGVIPAALYFARGNMQPY